MTTRSRWAAAEAGDHQPQLEALRLPDHRRRRAQQTARPEIDIRHATDRTGPGGQKHRPSAAQFTDIVPAHGTKVVVKERLPARPRST